MTEPGRRPVAYHDIRDDYDDEFARPWSPRQVTRRQVFTAGVAHVVIGVVGVLGVLGLAAGIFVRHYGRNWDVSEPVLIALLLVMVVVGWGLFAVVVAGGLSMIRMRGRRTALVAAYLVTGLSIAGLYAILFFPFGIWALILLYRSDVREEFERPAAVDVQHARL